MKEILKHKKPKKAQLNSVSDFNRSIVKETGNMQYIAKLSVLKNASSE